MFFSGDRVAGAHGLPRQHIGAYAHSTCREQPRGLEADGGARQGHLRASGHGTAGRTQQLTEEAATGTAAKFNTKSLLTKIVRGKDNLRFRSESEISPLTPLIRFALSRSSEILDLSV